MAGDTSITGNIKLPATTSAAGQIKINGNRFTHAYAGTFLGNLAGNFTSTGTNNTGVGEYTFSLVTTGSDNTAIGASAGNSTTTGLGNTYLGFYAGSLNTAGTRNVYVGYGAGAVRSTGSSNVYIGASAAYNWTANNNTLIGDSSGGLGSGFGGGSSTFVGYQTGFNTSGNYNVLLGNQAGYNLTTGSNNVIIGGNDGASIATASNNIIIADGAGNIRMKVDSAGNVGIGTAAPSATADVVRTSSGVGVKSSVSSTGLANFAFEGIATGASSGVNVGAELSASGSASGNQALRIPYGFPSAGAANYAIFSQSDAKSYFGGNVGVGTTTPGARLDVDDAGTTTSAIIVPRAGNFTGTTVNGMIRYNLTSTLFEFYQNGAWVNYTTVSDGRLKTNVEPVINGLDIVNQLNPVFYNWDRSNPKASSFEDKHEVGFIAQEVEKVLPEVVNKGEDHLFQGSCRVS